MNLAIETRELLSDCGKSENDIVWVGCREFQIPKELFWALAEKTNYDDGFGWQKIATDLLVVGNNFWLERHEYDGLEWWEYKELPTIPSAIRMDILRLDGEMGGHGLDRANKRN